MYSKAVPASRKITNHWFLWVGHAYFSPELSGSQCNLSHKPGV